MEASAPVPAGRKPIAVGRVIDETFSIYGANAIPLLASAFVIFLVAGLIQGLLSGVLLGLLSAAVNLVAIALYTGFVVKLVEDVRDGRRDSSAGELISSASGYIGPLLLNSILRGLAIAVGLFLLIVPGLYLLTIWAVCAPAIVAEDRDGMAAFGRSKELVEGQKMPVFLTIIVAFLITVVVSIAAAVIGAAIAGTAGAVALSIVAATATAPIMALVSTVIFFDLGGGSAAPADDRQVVVEY